MDEMKKQQELRREEVRAGTHREEQAEEQDSVLVMKDREDRAAVGREQEGSKAETRMREIVQDQSVRNRDLWASIQQSFSETAVSRTADVPHPPVQEPVARESRKQRRERLKKQELARKLCPVGDEHTINLSNAIKTAIRMRGNSFDLVKDCKKRAWALGLDEKMLLAYCRGYRKNIWGRPAAKKDRKAAKEDRAFLEAFLTGRPEDRLPYLEQATREIISMRFTPEMISPENIVKNLPELRNMTEKMTSFEMMMKANPEYFNGLDDLTKDLIAANSRMCANFSMFLAAFLGSRGIDYNFGNILGHKEEEKATIQISASVVDELERAYRQDVEVFREAVREAHRKAGK